jgi:hypothetical protein
MGTYHRGIKHIGVHNIQGRIAPVPAYVPMILMKWPCNLNLWCGMYRRGRPWNKMVFFSVKALMYFRPEKYWLVCAGLFANHLYQFKHNFS